ncbi:MAG: hypothetical protein JWR61_2472 [Ferruginibacter sp.]|uniref:hypothetical protein n=1 Tax=Ferruginibacter sp. TaxID=1940288 RepID=UPI002659FAB9|nr:hypothetical protein [Ferruginibacter sp.]MDB5277517.1 hypothetical protein [Ferruginibacter sp.]
MKVILFSLLAFVALTALFSGLLLISNPTGDLMHLPISLLTPTPFKNFLVPGIVLALAVGGINITAVIYNLLRHANRYHWAIAGGFTLLGFIIAQMILIHAANWLHFLYIGIALLIILLAYQLEGKWAV